MRRDGASMSMSCPPPSRSPPPVPEEAKPASAQGNSCYEFIFGSQGAIPTPPPTLDPSAAEASWAAERREPGPPPPPLPPEPEQQQLPLPAPADEVAEGKKPAAEPVARRVAMQKALRKGVGKKARAVFMVLPQPTRLGDVLRRLDDHFLKASESAHEVSKMLEAATPTSPPREVRMVCRIHLIISECANRFLRDVESRFSFQQYSFCNTIVRHLLEGELSKYKMEQESKLRRFYMWPVCLGDRGVETMLEYWYEDCNAPEKYFHLALMLRVSEYTDVVGTAVKCLHSMVSQFKVATETAAGEHIQIANLQQISDSHLAPLWADADEESHAKYSQSLQ